ncbi:MAG: PHB depolymerase family esterase, partial [Anaerolineales bacterium]
MADPVAPLDLVHRSHLPPLAGGQLAPAVVMVHGWGGDEKVMAIFERLVPPAAAIISPRAPLDMHDGGFNWYQPVDDEPAQLKGLESLRAFVAGLPGPYRIDPNRMVLVGFSQGAAMSAALLLSDPPLVLAVASLAGFLPSAAQRWVQPGRAAGRSVFMAHGSADTTVPIARAQAARDALQTAGAQVAYHEYE